jgi:hypothetical protein
MSCFSERYNITTLEHSEMYNDAYKNELAKKIWHVVEIDPSLYTIHEIEHIVDLVSDLLDILECDDGREINPNVIGTMVPRYIKVPINFTHLFYHEINTILDIFNVLDMILKF